MIKKIFLGSIFFLAIIFVVRSVSATNQPGLTDLIGQANNIDNNLSSYQPVETNVQVLAEKNIPTKVKTISTPTKQVAIKKRTKIIVHTPRHVSSSITKTAKSVSKTKTTAKSAVITPKTVRRTHYTSRYGTTMRWDATTLRYLSHLYNFDYSYAIRYKMISNMEKYARLHHVSEITMNTLNASTYR